MNSKLRKKIRKTLKEYYDFYPDFFDPLYNGEVHGFIGYKDVQGRQSISEEEIIDEGASNFIDIPPNVGLIKRNINSNVITFNLFDFKDQKCFGYLELNKLTDRSFMVSSISAEKGFGPLLLEIGMMGVYPSGICIDRLVSTKNAVWSMFEKFVQNRSEIEKTKIEISDKEYDSRYENSEEDRHVLNNIILSRPTSTWYNKEIQKGIRLYNESNVSLEDITSSCRGYFTGRYENG